MKFKEAFDKAFEKQAAVEAAKGAKFGVTPDTAKILAFFWNIVKAAENVLDDFVYIDENNQIREIEPKKPISKKGADMIDKNVKEKE